jgi:hypothetical protein
VLNREIENTSINESNRTWALAYIGRIIIHTAEIDSAEEEIERLLNRLGVESRSPIFSVLSIDELIMGLKFYLINWSTMKDLMATFINSVFDIGIDDKDITFEMILRNKKVKRTKIPEIWKKYKKSLNAYKIGEYRNDVVHRGKLTDPEVSELKRKKNKIRAERFSLLNTERISEDEYKRKMREFDRELSKMIPKKRTEYLDHFKKTISSYEEIAEELARITVIHLDNKRI